MTIIIMPSMGSITDAAPLSIRLCSLMLEQLIYDLVPKGVHENRTKGVENEVDDTLKLVVFLECAQR